MTSEPNRSDIRRSVENTVDHLKDAGGSTWDVVKDFSSNVQQRRANGADASAAETVREAARAARESASFDAAKEHYGKAYRETRDGVGEALSAARTRLKSETGKSESGKAETGKSGAAKGEPTQDASTPHPDVIEGEVISTDDEARR